MLKMLSSQAHACNFTRSDNETMYIQTLRLAKRFWPYPVYTTKNQSRTPWLQRPKLSKSSVAPGDIIRGCAALSLPFRYCGLRSFPVIPPSLPTRFLSCPGRPKAHLSRPFSHRDQLLLLSRPAKLPFPFPIPSRHYFFQAGNSNPFQCGEKFSCRKFQSLFPSRRYFPLKITIRSIQETVFILRHTFLICTFLIPVCLSSSCSFVCVAVICYSQQVRNACSFLWHLNPASYRNFLVLIG